MGDWRRMGGSSSLSANRPRQSGFTLETHERKFTKSWEVRPVSASSVHMWRFSCSEQKGLSESTAMMESMIFPSREKPDFATCKWCRIWNPGWHPTNPIQNSAMNASVPRLGLACNELPDPPDWTPGARSCTGGHRAFQGYEYQVRVRRALGHFRAGPRTVVQHALSGQLWIHSIHPSA